MPAAVLLLPSLLLLLLGLAGAWIGLTVQHCGKWDIALWMQVTFLFHMLRAEVCIGFFVSIST